jgi:DNA-directed RNA polymerase III subunit RPC3
MQLEHGLSAMIQMHLVYHHSKGEITYYEANIKDAYYLVRSGKMVKVVEDRLGSYAADVMFTIMSLGHVQVRYLESLPMLESRPSIQMNGVNGHTTDHDSENEAGGPSAHVAARTNGDHRPEKSLSHLRRTLQALAMRGYIRRVRGAHFQTDEDNQIDAEKIAESSVPKDLKGKKRAEWIDSNIRDHLRRLTNSDIFPQIPSFSSLSGTKRPYVNGSTHPRKRLRLDSSAGDGGEDGEDEDDEASEDDFEDDDPLEVTLKLSSIYGSRSWLLTGV